MHRLEKPAAKPIAVILAAGEGVRIGAPKALLQYSEGESFLFHIGGVFLSAGCDVLAVLGHDAARIEASHPDVRTVRNERWREGQLSSARLGIAAALEAGAATVLVHPVDMPTVGSRTVHKLLARAPPDHATVPYFGGRPGHPLLLPRPCAEAVLRESAPTLEAALSSIGVDRVDVDDAGVTLNINTPEDYQRAFGRPPVLAAGAGRNRAP